MSGAYAALGVMPPEEMSNRTFQAALTDVFWVLLNSGEFLLNH